MRLLSSGFLRSRLIMPLMLLILSLCALQPIPAAGAVPEDPVVSEQLPTAHASGLIPRVSTDTGFTAAVPRAEISAARDGVTVAPPQTVRQKGRALLLSLGFFAFGMAALTKDRNTAKRDGKLLPYPVGAAKKIYAGSLVVLNAGFAEAGTTALNLVAVGRANDQVDNTAGAAGDLDVLVERGVFLFANDGSIAQVDVGKTAYIVDDQTVADTDGAGTRSAAGTIRGVEAGGVWIEI